MLYVFNNNTDPSNLSYYQSINSAVKPIDQNEANLMQINALYLTYFMVMPDSFPQTGNLMDSADLSALYGIASQCYLTGGPAVFLARSMYNTAIRDDSTYFWDDCVNPRCGYRMLNTDGPQSPAVDSAYFFKVYPNPMDKQNSLNVKCSEPGDITFYDLLGQVTYRGRLIAGINIFNCTQLSCDNNVILYKAKMKSGKLETGKVVTLK